jgi:helix-turn-helix protein
MKLHANAALSLNQRRRMVRRVVCDGWSLTEAAEAAEVSERTCSKWVKRYLAEGEAGLLDRPSAPHSIPHLSRPTATSAAGRASCCISTSSSWAGSGWLGTAFPAGASSGAPPTRPTGGGSATPAGSSSTSASTTPPGSPTSRCSMTRRQQRPRAFCIAPSPSTAATASPSSASCPTTAPVIAPPSTRSPAGRLGCATCAPAPTGRAPTEKQNASSAPCWPGGPTAPSTPPARTHRGPGRLALDLQSPPTTRRPQPQAALSHKPPIARLNELNNLPGSYS